MIEKPTQDSHQSIRFDMAFEQIANHAVDQFDWCKYCQYFAHAFVHRSSALEFLVPSEQPVIANVAHVDLGVFAN